MEHIDNMTALRQNVSLQAYGQRDPLFIRISLMLTFKIS